MVEKTHCYCPTTLRESFNAELLRSGRSAPSDVVTGETVSDKCANILVIQLQLR